MLARGAAKAVDQYVEPIQRALSCITQAVLDIGGGYAPNPEGSPHVLTLSGGPFARLRGGQRIAITVVQSYRVGQEDDEKRSSWRVHTASYAYGLHRLEDERQVLAYHWHPDDTPDVPFPHLHIGSGAGDLRARFSKYHLPTGRVTVEDVVLLAVREFGVEPLRRDWERVLRESRRTFEQRRTW